MYLIRNIFFLCPQTLILDRVFTFQFATIPTPHTTFFLGAQAHRHLSCDPCTERPLGILYVVLKGAVN